GDPHVTIAVHVNAVRPHEHPAAEAADLLAGAVEVVHRVGLGAEAPWRRAGRAAVGGPHGSAVAVDGHAVGTAPRALLRRELGPIADDAIRVGAAVDGRHLVRLR